MPTLHITDSGKVAVCNASERACPRVRHFSTAQEAVQALNATNAVTTSALDEEASNFFYETGYRVPEILEERGVTLQEIEEAELSGRAVCVKIPGATEVYISTQLARRELTS